MGSVVQRACHASGQARRLLILVFFGVDGNSHASKFGDLDFGLNASHGDSFAALVRDVEHRLPNYRWHSIAVDSIDGFDDSSRTAIDIVDSVL
jgi:hypothetical protein